MENKLSAALCEALCETFAKIGYTRAAVALNYPPKTLATLLGDRGMKKETLDAALSAFFAAEKENFPGSTFRYEEKSDLYILLLSLETAERVKGAWTPSPFLSELVALSTSFFRTREDVHALFSRHGAYAFKKSPSEDFDEVLSFTDGSDTRLYCFEYGEERIEYHRFLREDYEDLFGKF